MIHQHYFEEIRQFLLQSVVKQIEERINDQAVQVVVNDFIDGAVRSIIKLDRVIAEDEFDLEDFYDEVLAECLEKAKAFSEGSDIMQMLEQKKLTEFTDGSEFLEEHFASRKNTKN